MVFSNPFDCNTASARPKIGPASVMQELRSRLIEWIGVLKGLLLSALGTKVSFVTSMTQNNV